MYVQVSDSGICIYLGVCLCVCMCVCARVCIYVRASEHVWACQQFSQLHNVIRSHGSMVRI